jgi:hypothetical protein
MTAAITWVRSGDRSIWLAEAPGGVVLAVTRLALDRWQPSVQDGHPGPVRRTRLEAQRWCERQVRPRGEVK